jgi:hypothetical protein
VLTLKLSVHQVNNNSLLSEIISMLIYRPAQCHTGIAWHVTNLNVTDIYFKSEWLKFIFVIIHAKLIDYQSATSYHLTLTEIEIPQIHCKILFYYVLLISMSLISRKVAIIRIVYLLYLIK